MLPHSPDCQCAKCYKGGEPPVVTLAYVVYTKEEFVVYPLYTQFKNGKWWVIVQKLDSSDTSRIPVKVWEHMVTAQRQ